MKNVKVRTQLFVLTMALVTGLVILSITSLTTFKRIETINRLAFKAGEVENQMLKLRKHEKDFLAREVKDPEFFKTEKSKYGDKFEADHAIVESLLNELRNENYIKHNSLISLVDSLDKSFIEYEDIFLEIAKNSLERGFKDWGLVGELRSSIHNVEEDIKANNLDASYMVDMLMLRRHEKDYFLRGDLKYQKKFHDQIETFKQNIKTNEKLSAASINSIVSNIDNYKHKFDIVINMDREIGLSEKEGHMGEMRAAIHNVDPLVERLASTLHKLSEKAIDTNTALLIIISIIIIAISIILGFVISKGIFNQLGAEPSELAIITKNIAQGNLTMDTNHNALGVMDSMQKMVKQLREVIEGINEGSDQIASASEETSSNAQTLSQGANEQAANIEEVSSTMEQIASNIQNNANNATETENISRNAFEGINTVNKASQQSLNSIQSIAEKITIINDIALQTNILALNAAVEAARAGEHGKGFAVVAAEVRKLAERSKDAAKEIVELANESVYATEDAATRMNEILPDIEKTSNLIQEISAASAEQRNGTDQVNNAIQQLNSVIQQNSASSEELAGNAEELYSQAEGLRNLIKYFKL